MATMDPDLAPFVTFFRKQRIFLRVMGAVSLVMAVGLFLIPKDRDMTEQQYLFMRVGVLVGFGAIGVYLAVFAAKPPERQPGLVALVSRAADVVWICPTVHKRNGLHVSTSYALGLIDGRKPRLAVSPRDESAAEAALQQRCPRAKFGYDPEWEKLFKANPAALRS
jgi:hypothetical protein